jgi:hypothetical protein
MSQLGTYNFFNIETLTGDAGGPVYAIAGNVNIVGDGIMTVVGNPLTATLTITTPGSVAISYTTDVGGPAVPVAHVLALMGGNNITTTGLANTVTFDLTGTTDHTVQVGNATGSLTSLAVGVTGEGLMGNTGANPGWTGSPTYSGTVTGGTGLVATTGDVTITAGNLDLPDTNAAGTQGIIGFGGSMWINNLGTHNTFVGEDSGNLALTIATTTDNTGIGYHSLFACDGSTNCVGLGATSLVALTSGDNNVACGSGSLSGLTTGSNCIALGYNAGSAATVASSSDIYIGNIGAAESNTIRIGTQGNGAGQQDKAYMAGIYGVTPIGTLNVALIDSNGQLGSVASLAVGQGGTGTNTLADHGVLVGSGINAITALAVGATGETLMGVTGADPGWTGSPSFSGSVTAGTNITASLGDITLTNGNLVFTAINKIYEGGTTGDKVFSHMTGTASYYAGQGSGWSFGSSFFVSATNTTAVGYHAFSNSTGAIGAGNTCVGTESMYLPFTNACIGNTAVGYRSCGNLYGGGGAYNVAIGYNALDTGWSDSYSIGIGYNAGNNVGAQAFSNIYLNSVGANESNTLRIGNATGTGNQELNTAYIQGIYSKVPSAATTSVVLIDSVGKLGSTALATNGQVLIGSTGAAPVWATLSSTGSTVAITNGAGSIDLEVITSGIAWSREAGAAVAASDNHGYVNVNAGLTTITLPATSVLGTTIEILGEGAGGWTIAQNGGQNIQYGNVSTTIGAGGSLSSSNRYDTVTLKCRVANTTWSVVSNTGVLNVV